MKSRFSYWVAKMVRQHKECLVDYCLRLSAIAVESAGLRSMRRTGQSESRGHSADPWEFIASDVHDSHLQATHKPS